MSLKLTMLFGVVLLALAAHGREEVDRRVSAQDLPKSLMHAHKAAGEEFSRREAYAEFLPVATDEQARTSERKLTWLQFLHGGKGKEGSGQEPAGTKSTDISPSARRAYLNDLVDASAEKTGSQLGNIAFIKTHKTGSTTMAYMLYRYARRHGVKLAHFDHRHSAVPLRQAVEQTQAGKGRVDIMHYHHSVFGQYDGNWEQAEQAYQQIMREDEKINFVTVLRDPRTHFLSYYYYFIQPATKMSLEDFVMKPEQHHRDAFARLNNSMAAEFGVRSLEEMESLLTNAIPHFALVILTEEFDEGLMVMRRLLGWDMIDMTYCTMYKTKTGAKRYDGKVLVEAPHFEDLPKPVQDKIDSMTELDQMLYDAAKGHYEERRIAVAQHLPGDLEDFEELQHVVSSYLGDNSTSMANAMYKTADIYSADSPLFEF